MSRVLLDHEIRDRAAAGYLISDSFNPAQAHGCCYEFRASDTAWRYDYEDRTTRRLTGQVHEIYPFQTLTLVTEECVKLEADNYLTVISKGSLFSLGLTPICTMADPGFIGHLGLTVTNLSSRRIDIKVGQFIAKGVFYQLDEPATEPYAGVHADARTYWPYPSHFHMGPDELAKVASSQWDYLAPPLKVLIKQYAEIRAYLRALAITLTAFISLNLVLSIVHPAITDSLFTTLTTTLNICGSVASIISIALAFRSPTGG